MIGSVFSPYYKRSGRHDPTDFHALNVGLYGLGKKRWTMTERGKSVLGQSARQLVMGSSTLNWVGKTLTVHIDEWANPLPRKVRGRLEIEVRELQNRSFQLDSKGRHFWQPIAPRARVRAVFEQPELNWEGTAYLDSNWGSEPLETGFTNWDWARAHLKSGTNILYDAFTRDGENRQLNLHIHDNGQVEELEMPPRQALNKGPIWRVERSLCTADGNPRTIVMLEDTPFYTRSRVEGNFAGERAIAVHESLDCDRFDSGWVQALLPFRMPRRG